MQTHLDTENRAETAAQQNLLAHLAGVPDPRIERQKLHPLTDLLAIALCSLLCGGTGFTDMACFGQAKQDWFRRFLPLPHGIPSHDTFNRVFSLLDPQAFLECFLRWTQGLREVVAGELVALDGKALRRALDQGQPVQYILSAWAADNRLVLGQLKVEAKSNEITAVPKLLRALELAGCIVTLDAMGCQKQIAREILAAGADYVLALKGNQGNAHQEVQTFLDEAIAETTSGAGTPRGRPPLAKLDHLETVEKNGGRIETRRYWHTDEVEWFADRKLWRGLRSLGVVEAVREIRGEVSVARRYYLSSLGRGVERFARAVRGHWGIKNQLHWVLDVQMGEDASRVRRGHAPENLATSRRLALNLLRRDQTCRRGIAGKRLNAAWKHDYLIKLLAL